MYPWLVFAMVFALMLSDYMSRQVLSAVFPLLKVEWGLSDTGLASLNSAVALMVGVFTLPLSLLADRWGRVKSVVLMAVIWSAATMLSAVAANYDQMLAARFLVGVGEAAYGSVGLAILLGVFAPHMRATMSGAFQAAGSFGSVIGVALGGYIALHLGWRWSLAAMAIFGLVLAAMFSVTITEKRLARHNKADTAVPAESEMDGYRAPFRSVFGNPSVVCAYLVGGLQLFVAAVLLAWLPSFFNRYHDMDLGKAGVTASIYSLLIALGMIGCGMIADRVSRHHPARKWATAVAYCALAATTLFAAFRLAPGAPQMVLLGIGAFFAAGSSGPVTALVASLIHPSLRASGFGMLTLAYSLLGMALGPFAVGVVADQVGLLRALQLAPLVGLVVIAILWVGRRWYPASLRTLAELTGSGSNQGDRAENNT